LIWKIDWSAGIAKMDPITRRLILQLQEVSRLTELPVPVGIKSGPNVGDQAPISQADQTLDDEEVTLPKQSQSDFDLFLNDLFGDIDEDSALQSDVLPATNLQNYEGDQVKASPKPTASKSTKPLSKASYEKVLLSKVDKLSTARLSAGLHHNATGRKSSRPYPIF
jgi:hypothetical protein